MTALLERQVATAMALEDGTSVRFADGVVACVGRRAVRDGARVALLTVPGLLRLDLRCHADTLSFALRHLSGQELEEEPSRSEPRPIEAPDGTLRHEHRLRFALRDGPRVEVVVWLAPFRGEMLHEHGAVALIHEG
jgi:hypothetical protein